MFLMPMFDIVSPLLLPQCYQPSYACANDINNSIPLGPVLSQANLEESDTFECIEILLKIQ